jgi:hypothetical protein
MITTTVRFLAVFLILIQPLSAQAPRPPWVDQRLKDNDFYHGIGKASLKNQNAQDQARINALKSISLSISTEISVLSKRNVMEVDDVSNTVYANEVVVSSVASIGDLELVGDYEDKKFHYVYYKYSKAKHRSNIDQAKQRAKSVYKEFLSYDDVDVYNKVSSLVKCYELIQFTYGESVNYTDSKVTFDLWTKVPGDLQNIIRQIRIVNDSQELRGVYGYQIEEPLRAGLQFILPPPYNLVPGGDLMVEFYFTAGAGDFSFSSVKADNGGFAETYISKVQSPRPTQLVKARVDLKAYKNDQRPSAFLDKKLNKIADYSQTSFNIEISKQQNDQIAIYVKSSQGIDNITVKRLNNYFEAEFLKISDYEIKDRNTAEKILEETGQNSADVCDSEECRILIGKTLQVDKFILVDVVALSSNNRKTIQCQMRITNITEKTTEQMRLYDDIYRESSAEEAVRKRIPEWVQDFYNVLNPGVVNFMINPSFTGDIAFYIDGQYTGQSLPIYEYELDSHGKHTFSFEASGYESKKISYNINPQTGLVREENINLKKKSRFKAFLRSSIFPGMGQIYSADASNLGRRRMGRIFQSMGLVAFAGTAISWYGYDEAHKVYDSAYTNYLNSNQLNQINDSRDDAQDKHQKMTNIQSIAIGVSTITGAIWLFSALEAAISFPDYYATTNREGFDFKFVYNDGEIIPSVGYRTTF